MRWIVIDPPDRWDLASAVLELPELRRDLEFFRRVSGRLVPLHVRADGLVYRDGEPLTVLGTLTYVRDRPHRGKNRVAIRLWPHLRRGELTLT